MLLDVQGVTAGYGAAVAVEDVSLQVPEHTFVALLGGNGAGKSTLLKVIVGEFEAWSGQVTWRGERITGLPPHELAKRGLRLMPQGHQVFGPLTVEENLEMGGYLRSDHANLRQDIEAVMEMFPQLGDRRRVRASSLSGGERAFLGLGQLVVGKPEFVLLDEPSAGLAPQAMTQVFRALKEIQREKGLTGVLVEQNVHHALQAVSYAYVLQEGKIVVSGKPEELQADDRVRHAYLSFDRGPRTAGS